MYSSGTPRAAIPGQNHFVPDTGYTMQTPADCSRILAASGRHTPDQWYAPFGSPPGSVAGYDASSDGSKVKKAGKRSTYKHIPHRDKPPHLVQRRNARERRRVQAVNNAFVRPRRHIPHENKNKRLSKVKTLRIAIDYISQLQQMIKDHDAGITNPYQPAPMARSRRVAFSRRPDHASRANAPGGSNGPGYEVNQFGDFSKENTKLWINMNFVSVRVRRTTKYNI